MEFLILILVLGICVYYVYYMKNQAQLMNLIEYIEKYIFPVSMKKKIKSAYPNLNNEGIDRVFDGLRLYFIISHVSKNEPISMPSQVVDVAWHEFILNTLEYKIFCDNAFGQFLHHKPSEAMKTKTTAQDGIRRTWKISCELDGINPQFPNKLPPLFSIDTDLHIDDGYRYALNCESETGAVFCVSHIGCEGFGLEERAEISI